MQAAPFRAHLDRLIDLTGLPWTELANHALVPPAVVHRLLFGRNGRRVARIPPDYARRLLQLDERRLLALAGRRAH